MLINAGANLQKKLKPRAFIATQLPGSIRVLILFNVCAGFVLLFKFHYLIIQLFGITILACFKLQTIRLIFLSFFGKAIGPLANSDVWSGVGIEYGGIDNGGSIIPEAGHNIWDDGWG